MSNSSYESAKCRFAVVTALPKEFAAMLSMLDEVRGVTIPGDPNDYSVGRISATDGTGRHYIVVALQKKPANNSASAVASHLAHSFPNLQDVLMVGIAGGVPHPDVPDKHVRLGDVVVCDHNGIVQYDHLKLETDQILVRSAAAPPSASLLGRVRLLEAARLAGSYPWERHIERAAFEGAARPDPSTDRIFDHSHIQLRHPDDPYRRSGKPRIHYGPIGSSNVLLKDAHIRDELRDRFGVRAIEMEGSGIADGTWTAGLGYIVIRGISDYCDQNKSDLWQGYAAVAAASYARALIESIAVITDPATQRQLDKARAKMSEAQNAVDDNTFDTAAKAAEDAANLAASAEDNELQRRALLQAIRAWGEHLGCGHAPNGETTAVTLRARKLLMRLEELGERDGIVALEMAQLGRFDRPASDVLNDVQRAAKDEDPTIRAEALVIHLQTLWRMKDLDKAAELTTTLDEMRQTILNEDVRLIVEATWLRTLCKAGKHQMADVKAFIQLTDAIAAPKTTSYQRMAMMLGQVAAEFNVAGDTGMARLVCEAAYRLVAPHSDAPMLMNIALQTAELSAALNDINTARVYLGRAESWATHSGNADQAATLRANVLFTKGRTLTRLADQTQPADPVLYEEAFDALDAARVFGQEMRLKVQGNVEIFLAEVSWWLGRTAVNLGRLDAACVHLKSVRSDAAMANPRFCADVVPRAWVLEAEALALSGRLDESEEVVKALIEDVRIPNDLKDRARQLVGFLKSRIRPTIDWFNSTDAISISRECSTRDLHTVVADRVAPLVAWWHDWHEEDSGAESELLDFWGRGGFSTVAAAIRTQAHMSIAVDAKSVSEIKNWARILCPLFETVVIKWKGELGTGLVLVPQHVDYAGPGGHGYAVTSDRCNNERYAVALSWANPIPREVTSFLAGEALPLFRAGRLLVLPAPLVGCSQSAVGWTDNLLVEGLLGGIVSVGRSAADSKSGPQRILDLARVRLPFINNITMRDLASVLRDTERWTGPLRRQITGLLASGDLNNERWASISSLEQEIRDACRELTTAWNEAGRGYDWRVDHVDGALAVGSRGPTQPPAPEPVTGFLQSIAFNRRELAPWIPYWRLQDLGGYLNWTCPLDNCSKPPDPSTLAQMTAMGMQNREELHSWLYPGTGGWHMPVARRISV